MKKTDAQFIPIYNFMQVVPAFTKLLGGKKGLVLSYMVGKANTFKKECFFITYEQITNDLLISQSTLYRYFREFQTAGYMTIIPAMGRNNNKYCLNMDAITELTKKTNQNEESYNQNKTRQNEELTRQNDELTNQNEELTRQNDELTNQNDESKKLNTGLNTGLNTELNTKLNTAEGNNPPNKTKSVFGYSVNKVEEWIDYMLIPEYQNPEHSTKRNEAANNLFEAMNDVLSNQDISFDEFIRIYYPSLDNRYRETLKSIILYS